MTEQKTNLGDYFDEMNDFVQSINASATSAFSTFLDVVKNK